MLRKHGVACSVDSSTLGVYKDIQTWNVFSSRFLQTWYLMRPLSFGPFFSELTVFC